MSPWRRLPLLPGPGCSAEKTPGGSRNGHLHDSGGRGGNGGNAGNTYGGPCVGDINYTGSGGTLNSVVGNGVAFGFSGVGVEVLAILAATLSYGASASYIKKLGSKLAPLKMTFGSMLSGAVFLMPLAYYCWPVAPIFLSSWMAVIGLGAISTAYAYVLYFKLIEEIGPAQAIASTFLIPVFGMLFGELFLQEETSLRMIVGACIILIGTALSIGFIRPDLLLKRFKKS